jgi:pectin methylesterase-like acyl-CoA thioesterase
MAGSRRPQPVCSLVAIVALLSISWVSGMEERDYITEAQDNYKAWINAAVARDEIQSSTAAAQLNVVSLATSESTITITVNSKKGKAQFQKLQKAIDSIPDKSTTRYIINVAAGTYK